MVSVMMLTVSLMTVGLLVVRSSVREVTQAGQLVARERALMAAQATLDLAAARYVTADRDVVNAALAGTLPQGADCSDPCSDCIPDATTIVTGQRNDLLAGGEQVSCGGRPCMRQGAVVQLPAQSGAVTDWCDVPMRDLVGGGDPEARVSIWIRNNTADALSSTRAAPSWIEDADGRVVFTAMATVRNTTVAIEQEMLLSNLAGPTALLPQSPDEGYGGGHNNDNSAVSVCVDDFVTAEAQ
ncbi:MAG: hypothetical protein KDK70_19070 [Myxococcales bacterium]|nr:hypothetical protein [Myxococcales bacterium]